MPNLVNNDKLLLTIYQSLGEQTLLNTHILQYTEGLAGPEDYQGYANAYLTDLTALGGFIDQIVPLMSNKWEVTKVALQKVYPTRLAAVQMGSGQIGDITANPLPSNTALVVTKKSMSATRWGIGSWHQGGLPISAMLDDAVTFNNTWTVGIRAALTTWFLPNRVPTGKSGRVEPILWDSNTPLRITPITSYVEQIEPRTMHRRTKGLGI